LSAAEDARSPAAARFAAARYFARALLKSVVVSALIAIVPVPARAQNASSIAPNDRAQADSGVREPIVVVPSRDSGVREPIVIVPSRRVPVTVPSQKNGPVVVPQHVVAGEPVARVPGQTDDRREVRPPARSETMVAPPAPPQPPVAVQPPVAAPPTAFRAETDDDRGVGSGFREPGGFGALYRASHFGGRNPRDEQGLFGAQSGLLTGSCGPKGKMQQRADAAERCMSALAFVVSPPPATRGVLPRNLPTIAPRDAQPIPPVAAATPPPPPMMEEDPYEQKGIKAGNFLLKPAVEMTTGYDSNPGRVPGGAGSPVVVVAPVLLVRSQFDRHALNADLRASYVDDPALQKLSHPTVDARVNGRYDLTDTMALNGEGHLAVDADDPGTARFTNLFTKIPLVTTVGGSAGFAQKFDNLQVTAKGTVDRLTYQDAPVVGGGVIGNGDRNFNQYGAQTRVSYAVTPELSPFVDVSVDRRVHDLPVDFNGFRRDSTGTAVEGGVTFGFTDKLTGDAAIGYLVRQYQDVMLRPVGAFIADANLMYQLNKENSIQFGAKSQVIEIAEVNTSGVLKRDVTLEFDHQFQPWLIGTLATGYGQDAFVGTTRLDNRYFVDLGLQYKVSRLLQLRANLRREETRSNVPVNNLAANVVTVGARVQY
jgi:hypothetical protein